LALARGQEVKISQLFEGFSYFIDALLTYLLMCLFIFLWLLLLIIPGIMATYSYFMAFYKGLILSVIIQEQWDLHL
jgi:uncharacterized membrane protein